MFNVTRKQLTTITSHEASDDFSATYTDFMLTDVPDYSDFYLFKWFRMCLVKIQIWPGQSVNTTGGLYNSATPQDVTFNYNRPEIWSIVVQSPDDLPSSLTEFLQWQGMRRSKPGRGHKRVFKPRVLSELYLTSMSTSYTPKGNQWLDTVNANAVPHNGIMIALLSRPEPDVTGFFGLTTMSATMMITFYLQFKQPY